MRLSTPSLIFLIGPTPKALQQVMLFNYGPLYSPIAKRLSSRNIDILKENNVILPLGVSPNLRRVDFA